MVTGAAGGIDRAIAMALSQQGASIVAADVTGHAIAADGGYVSQ